MEEQTNKLLILKKELDNIKNGEDILKAKKSCINIEIKRLEETTKLKEAMVIQSPDTLLRTQKEDFDENLQESTEELEDLEIENEEE